MEFVDRKFVSSLWKQLRLSRPEDKRMKLEKALAGLERVLASTQRLEKHELGPKLLAQCFGKSIPAV